MGFYERGYSRGGRGHAGAMSPWSVTTWLIAVNVGVYFADAFSHRLLTGLGAFSAFAAIGHLQLWRFITFQFLHANLEHILFNMLALYLFGPMIEAYLGRPRFLVFYLLCGIAGAAAYLVLLMLNILPGGGSTTLVGASAGIFGVLVAAAHVAPNTQVMLMFPPIPMRLRTLAWLMIGIAVFTIIWEGNNAGGEAAHLGGAALGALLIRQPKLLAFVNRPFRSRSGPFNFDDWKRR